MATKSAKAPAAGKRAKPTKPRLTLAEAMAALQKAGSEQTRKTYLRHGAREPLFGVSFATLKTLHKAIGVDHELAIALWDTGNLDESRHGMACAKAWLAAQEVAVVATGWTLVGVLAMRDESAPDSWFLERVAQIEKSIHTAPNAQRQPMNSALIQIGCRSTSLRKAATAAAKKIGTVSIDHGDTACQTADATAYIDKTWAHSTSKGYENPAAHERSRESARLRC